VLANYPYCCHEDAVAVVEDELVITFSGSGVSDFVLSSGIGVVVIVVFEVVVSKLELRDYSLKLIQSSDYFVINKLL